MDELLSDGGAMMHRDGAALLQRARLLRRVFRHIRCGYRGREGQLHLQVLLQRLHDTHVQQFGPAVAETLRAQAWADVNTEPLPHPEATESDFDDFNPQQRAALAALRDDADPFAEPDAYGAMPGAAGAHA